MRYTMDQMYEKYKNSYTTKKQKTLMLKMYSRKEFEAIYAATKAERVINGRNTANITREMLQDQDILNRDRLRNAENKGLTEIRKQFMKMRNSSEIATMAKNYADYSFEPYHGNIHVDGMKPFVYTDSQMFFAAMIDAGYSEDEAKEAYGY